MFHPLLDNPKSFKDVELESKILDLSKKYHIAARSGNGGLCSQILIILESLKEEQSNRQKSSLEERIKKQNKDLDDLINID